MSSSRRPHRLETLDPQPCTKQLSDECNDNAAVPNNGTAALPIGGSGYVQSPGSGQHEDSDPLKPKPTTPESVSAARYNCRHRFDEKAFTNSVTRIPAMTISLERPASELSESWMSQEHPEGQQYYIKSIDNVRYCTDLCLDDQDTLQAVNASVEKLHSELHKCQNLPSDLEVGLHLCKDGPGEPERQYYLVSAQTRSVFWLEEVDVNLVSCGVQPIPSLFYLKEAIRAQYWQHVTLFPHGPSVTEELVNDVNQTLDTLAFDAATSNTSTSPYDFDDLQKLLSVTRNIRAGSGAYSIPVRRFTPSQPGSAS
ncbi:hypothetical protein DAEQUDRAFT_233079 [Daedalea quercina L-15889]|uniref:WW domain-containing protein n=1 Tax=Daedalea quercina L-15889 TaxID=1314783 RepID=A0A165QUH9_9APHY|nr:hypothetical protein DAEQUDRAFT_233079 [Daedalea quercina L-15889]